MANFPPNLEDGESWLLSDIIREIQSTTFKLEDGYSQTFDAHAHSHLPVHILGIAVNRFLMPIIIAYLQRSVPVLLPVLYHPPGPFYVSVPCFVEMVGGCFGGTGSRWNKAIASFSCLDEKKTAV